MSPKTDSAHSLMQRHVSEILFYVWDPIGVNGMVQCRDEYEDYVYVTAAYLLSSCTRDALSTLLVFIVEDQIGISLDKPPDHNARHQDTLRMLMELQQEVFSRYPAVKQNPPHIPLHADLRAQIAWSRTYKKV